jgi:hypothetical protein
MRNLRTARISAIAGLGVLLFCLAHVTAARAEAPRACVEAVERGQSLRDKVKLVQAKAAFLACAASTCPEVIQRDCAQWVAELETRIPTVILTASDASGHDVVYARVTVDGEPFVDRLDGIAVAIDPGIHAFRIEPKTGPPLEQTVVIREAEKYQKQHFTLPAPPVMLAARPLPTPEALSLPGAAPVQSAPLRASPSSSSGWKTGAIVSISVAGVAAASFAGFGIGGAVDVSHLRTTCAPVCSVSSTDAAKSYLEVADVSLGVGVAALALATWMYFEWRGHTSQAPSVGVSTVGVRF